MKFKLREDDETNSAMEVMVNNMEYQKNPCVGIFWYDTDKKELFGVHSSLAEDVPWYESPQFKNKVRTDRRLHQSVWEKEFYRRKDPRFSGNYTMIPRGRVFEFEGTGFKVYTGLWINDYPECKDLVIEEFQLPKGVEFVQDSHWDLGHGWSTEF